MKRTNEKGTQRQSRDGGNIMKADPALLGSENRIFYLDGANPSLKS